MKHNKSFLPTINELFSFLPLNLSECTRLAAADERATAHLHPKRAAHLKQRRKARWPTPYVDEDGVSCYLVPLNARHDCHALVELEDYWSVRDSGADGLWCANHANGFSYVQTEAPLRSGKSGRKIYLARLILGLSVGKKVSYANGDGLDLRRKNLVAVGGNGRRSAASIVRRSIEERERAATLGWWAWQDCLAPG
ncbi:hypothetical protein [Pacificitalea manganoxidans]|uniref:hypothetical protein n=1 Tax=Pacificitalea manganoxidans TaxID=1411902 RepID=UPI0012FD9C08|nr:hypothetical protein [Pacificitalea manganoxidans]MDR6308146.1 hypothetical protein [Pacificitalea manganoxidans]